MIRTHDAGTLRAADGRPAGHPGRLGGAPPRPRRRGLHRPARRERDRPGRAPRGRRRARPARRVLRAGHRHRAGPARPGTRTPSCRPARSRSPRPTSRCCRESDPLPFPIESGAELSEEVRLKYRYLDIRRADMAAALRARSTAGLPGQRRHARARLRQRGDPVPDPVDPRGRPRLPGPGPAAARQLVRAAAVPAAVQAAADGVRAGALLPARALLPGRGLPRRPAARVHPDRHRDVLRHPRGRRGAWPRTLVARLWSEIVGYEVPRADPADDLRRRHGPVRVRQARPAVRAGAAPT